MEAYKFETIVLKDGVIKIPHFNKFTNKEVEIFIVFKDPEEEQKQKITASEFLKKWTGFIPEIDPEKEKYNYLTNKYK